MMYCRFCEFLGAVLGLPALYRLADQLGAATVNIFHPGTRYQKALSHNISQEFKDVCSSLVALMVGASRV